MFWNRTKEIFESVLVSTRMLLAALEEINADITAYIKKYKNILFIIYDLGIIRDETEIKRDIENIDGVNILVIKH